MAVTVRAWFHHPLTRNSAFMHLWAGQTAAQVGFQVGTLATSAIAISVLRASETQIGVLSALQTLAFLIVGLPAGAWVDGWRKRRVMTIAGLARIGALISIPLAYVFATLTLTHLMIVAALLGLCTVFFDVAYQSYVPIIASRRYIGAANGRLEASYQVGHAGGPGLGGWLLGLLAPPLVYLLTALTYVFSTWAIWRIATPEPAPTRTGATLVAQIREGLAFVRGQRLLFPLFSCIAAAAFAAAGIQVLLPILVLRTLDMSATQLGLLLSVGAIGGILGALTRSAWMKHLGIGRTIVVTSIIGVAVLAAQPTAVHAPRCGRSNHCSLRHCLLLFPHHLQRHPDESASRDLPAPHARTHERDLSLCRVGRHAAGFPRVRRGRLMDGGRGRHVRLHCSGGRSQHRHGPHPRGSNPRHQCHQHHPIM